MESEVPMTMKIKPHRLFLATIALTAVVLAASATDASAGDGARGARPRGARFERGPRGGSLRDRFRAHRHRRAEMLRTLGVTADQQRAALEKARAAQPVVADARRELAKLLVQEPADDAARTARRDAIRDLRRRTGEKLAPLAKDVVASLTPEQRAKLQGFAAARGRTFDEEKFVRRVGRWLARPMTAEVLEARLSTK